MKKIICLILLSLVGVLLFSCASNTSISAPTNLKIEGTIISFDEVTNAEKYRISLSDGESTIKRFVTNGMDLNTLGILEGEYMVKIQAIDASGNESDFSEEVSYSQKDLNAVKELKASSLLDSNYIKWMGRTSYNESTKVNTLYYSASGFEVKVKKVDTSLSVNVVLTATNYATSSKRPYVVLVLDNDFENVYTRALSSAETTLEIVGESGFVISDNEVHTVAVYKRSESIDSHVGVKELTTDGKFVSGMTYKNRKIEVIAASSSTGYGNLGNSSTTKTTENSDALKAFAFLSAQQLNAEINIVSASGWGVYASRWTTPNLMGMGDKYKYVDVFSTELWNTSNYVPDVIVTNFGTNDLSFVNLGANQTEKDKRMEAFISTYVDFLKYLHNTYPNAQIIILYGLMNESGIYDQHTEIYNRAKADIANLDIIKINGDAKGCNSHPSAASHQTIADTLSDHIKTLMGW